MEQNKKERKIQGFSNGEIYIIRNNINDLIYIGSTCNSLLSKRFGEHRTQLNNKACMNYKLYQAMREYGRYNFYIELLEDYKCERREQLRQKEGELIREYKPELNTNIPGRSINEYRESNKKHY